MSVSILKDFAQLKNRKINIENLLNSMTAFVAMRQVIEQLREALATQNV
jgi:hypothetical protein